VIKQKSSSENVSANQRQSDYFSMHIVVMAQAQACLSQVSHCESLMMLRARMCFQVPYL
jgi:hypothetical protein